MIAVEVEDQIRQLDTKAKEMEAKKQSMLEDIRTLRKGTVAKPGAKKGAVTAKKDAPKKVGAKGAAKKGAAQEGDEDVVVEVADAGGNGEDGSGAQDEGQQEQQNRKGLLSMLFGDFGKNEQPVAPGVTRISHQVGNIPGDEAHEQFERSLEDSNYIRSA